MALFLALVDHAGPDPQEPLRSLIGPHAAELWTLRLMSLSFAAKLASGEDPMLEASIFQDLGNSLEQDLPRLVQASRVYELDRKSVVAGENVSVSAENGRRRINQKKNKAIQDQ